MTKPLISAIIPTWDRRDLLRETLNSFRAQTLPPDQFEVIVVDNRSTDGTGEMVAELQAAVAFPLHYIVMPANRGPVVSRNHGARVAKGEILAFTDSDCVVCPEWLETAVNGFHEHPDAAFLCGPTVNKPGQTVRFFSVGASDGARENPIYPTCNVCYHRAAFERAGGFDDGTFLFNLGNAPVECSDADLAWRIKESGLKSVYLPGMLVHHEVREATPWEWISAHLRVMLIPLLVKRHPGLARKLLWKDPICAPENALFYGALAGVILAVVWSPWFALAALPFLLHFARYLRPTASLLGVPRLFGQVFFVILRQGVICGSLLYGSARCRRLVL